MQCVTSLETPPADAIDISAEPVERSTKDRHIADLEAALREVLADRLDAEWSMGTDWAEKVDRLLAPSTSETAGKPKPIAGEVGCEDANGMLTIHLESETCEVCKELCRSCGKPPGQHDDDCINHAGQFGYEPNRDGKS